MVSMIFQILRAYSLPIESHFHPSCGHDDEKQSTKEKLTVLLLSSPTLNTLAIRS